MNNLFHSYDAFLTMIVRLVRKRFAPASSLPREVPTKSYFFRLSIREQIFFLKRLGMMLDSGMVLLPALHILNRQRISTCMSQLLVTVTTDVERGLSLAKALGAYARSLSPLIITVIALGERSGTLAHNLLYGASELQKRHEVRKQIIGALIYPVIVVSASLSIAVFLLLVIFPKITPIFIDLGADLPLSTRVLLGFSDWLGAYGWWLVVGIVTLIVALITTRNIPRMQIVYAWLQLRLPLFGRLLQAYHLMTICRTLGMLGRSHIPVVTALTITADSMPQVLYKQALQELATSVASGQGLAKQLALRPGLFPPTVCQLIEVGETTGKLSETCIFISELYDSDIRDQIKNLTTVLEPALMLGMGLLIGFIAVSIITPIYGITQLLN